MKVLVMFVVLIECTRHGTIEGFIHRSIKKKKKKKKTLNQFILGNFLFRDNR